MGYESGPGDAGATPVEQAERSPSELAEAAKGMAEIADQVKVIREGMRSLRESMRSQAMNDDPAAAHPRPVGELHEAAVALEESARHLTRAVALVSAPASAAEPSHSDRDVPLPEGLRILIGSLRVAGWNDEEVAAYLRREHHVSDASSAVDRALYRSPEDP